MTTFFRSQFLSLPLSPSISSLPLLLLFLCISPTCALWPIPSYYLSGNTVLWIASDIQFHFSLLPSNTSLGRNHDIPSSKPPAIIQSALDRTRQHLFEDKFVPWKFHPRNTPFEPSLAHQTLIHHVHIQQNHTDTKDASRPLVGEVDESYTLSITKHGAVRITAASSNGVLYALETFTQLFYQHSQSTSSVYTPYAPVTITDSPKFPYRGLNLDVARNYYPKDDILRTIDALAWNKFNRLHLHITDSQSWPLEIPALPDLAKNGAYRKDLTYSPKDIQDIQQYGVARGIEVILEIDMPGHTASIALSDPDLITAFNIQPAWSTYANEPPSGQLKLNSPAVYAFLEKVWNDLLPRLSPYSAYFHTGGDEINVNAYNFDPTVKSNLSSVIQPYLQKLVDFNHAKLRANGLTPIVWEEMLLDWNLKLGSDVIVQTWLSEDSVANTVAKGHKALVGNYNFWYLDCGKGQWIDFYPASAATYWPFADYCTPSKNWRLIYSYDPLAGIPPNATHLVLGGEVHMWSEQTDGVNLDDMIWPRASAAGEVLWSGAKNEAGENRSQVEASPRLSEIRERLVRRGVRAGPVQMVFCTQNGTQCAL